MNRARTVPVPKLRRVLGISADRLPPLDKDCGRRRHATYDSALHAAVKAAKHSGRPIRVIPCRSCGGFHLKKLRPWEDR